jgi:hypothetical protein
MGFSSPSLVVVVAGRSVAAPYPRQHRRNTTKRPFWNTHVMGELPPDAVIAEGG